MTTNRSNFVTRNTPSVESRSDLDVSFLLNPVTQSISRVVNEAAVAQAIRLTLLTIDGEWPFEPDNGTALNRSLFDPSDEIARGMIEDTITNAVHNRCSAYASLVGVQVRPRSDSRYLDALVAYTMIGSERVAVVSVVLRRVR